MNKSITIFTDKNPGVVKAYDLFSALQKALATCGTATQTMQFDIEETYFSITIKIINAKSDKLILEAAAAVCNKTLDNSNFKFRLKESGPASPPFFDSILLSVDHGIPELGGSNFIDAERTAHSVAKETTAKFENTCCVVSKITKDSYFEECDVVVVFSSNSESSLAKAKAFYIHQCQNYFPDLNYCTEPMKNRMKDYIKSVARSEDIQLDAKTF